ncbi:hypothetical protein AAX26_01653 [Aliarcobacter thereius]|uniref:hypothetical protein n=1 Tax=Aliarcobacter thereius TaxID=544718 RepID=UPI0008278AE8|nr:hypothetical protein [Aliarcobacter thereius]OCL86003.1 hypothetical protein AAX26_01653 [Aliarcobacter thereius]
MLKKALALSLSVQLNFGAGMVVSDPVSYTYFMEQVAQYTEMINAMTTQIETLGGIQSAVDDTKRNIYNVSDNLQGLYNNLQNAMQGLMGAMENAEVKSLFDTSRESIKTNSSDGIFYKDIREAIDGLFQSMDETLMKQFDQGKLMQIDRDLKRLTDALKSNSAKDARSKLLGLNYSDMNNSLLIKDLLNKSNKEAKEAYKNFVLSQNNDIYNDIYNPTDELKKEQEANQKKLEGYFDYIQNSSDLYQQTQTTNMILMEIVKILQEEYLSAVTYRNSMSLMFIENADKQDFNKKLQKSLEIQKKLSNGVISKEDLPGHEISKLKKSDPMGIGFRPWKGSY